ncbi:MAG: glycosyltransferase family 2 protein [Marivirga sp.]|nr:glycosyltransferase family 2 protein [Marivirga sp.]
MIYTIIPVHNRKNFTRDCLISLRDQTIAHKVVIVDDGSTDGTNEMLRTEFPEVIVIEGDGNLFWTAAINLGIKRALDLGADYIFTLNNDTIAAPDLIEKMLLWAERTPDALLGAFDIEAKTMKPHYGGEIIIWRWDKSRFLLNELKPDEWHGIHEVSLFPGRGLLIPRKVFDKVGLFEEKLLPHYMADYDFTHLARRNGFKIYCNYDAKVYTYPEESGNHLIQKSKTWRNYYNHLFSIRGGSNLRNYTIYIWRNCPWIEMPMSLAVGYMRRIFGFWLK